MATITASPSISTISYSGTSAKSGTMSWTKPTVPSGATISSCKLTGTCIVSASSRQVTVTVNRTTVANKANSGNYNFEIDLGTSNNTTSVTVAATGSQKQASGTVSFSNLVYTVTYEEASQVKTYTVIFKDWDGSVLKTQTVEEGSSATAPSNPTRNGYSFTGWDTSFNNITSDLNVTAQYSIKSYTVTFKDWDGTTLKTQTVNHGSNATAPSNPTREGYEFTGWNVSFNNVTSDLIVTAQYIDRGEPKEDTIEWSGLGTVATGLRAHDVEHNNYKINIDWNTQCFDIIVTEDFNYLSSATRINIAILDKVIIGNNIYTPELLVNNDNINITIYKSTDEISNYDIERNYPYTIRLANTIERNYPYTIRFTKEGVYVLYESTSHLIMERDYDLDTIYFNEDGLNNEPLSGNENDDYDVAFDLAVNEYSGQTEEPETPSGITIAQYKFNSSIDTVPIFNINFVYTYKDVDNGDGTTTIMIDALPISDTDFVYTYTDVDNNDGTTTRTIMSNSIPNSISFMNCTGLLEVYDLNLGNSTNLDYLFYGCDELTYIDTSKIKSNTEITSLNYAFYDCNKLAGELDLSKLNVKIDSSLDGAFLNCVCLTSINLNGWDISEAYSMYATFENCTNLRTLNIDGWDFTNIVSLSNMFLDTNTLSTISIQNSIASSIMNFIYFALPQRTNIGNVLNIRGIDNLDSLIESGVISYAESCNWEVVYDVIDKPETPSGIIIAQYKFNSSIDTLPTFNSEFTYEYTDVNNGDGTITRTITSGSSPTSISFNGETGLVNVSYLDTSNVTDMSYMFYNCSNLTSLDVSSFNTSNVTTMQSMFYGCSSLISLDLSSFDTTNVTTIETMFAYCSNLLTVTGLNDLDVSNVNNMGGLFSDCSNITEINVSDWDVSKVTNFGAIFRRCPKLTNIDVSKWDTSSGVIMSGIFTNDSSLIELDLSSWDMSHANSVSQMFYGCSSLMKLKMCANLNQDAVTTYWFGKCNSLNDVQLSDFDTYTINKVIDELPTRTANNQGSLIVPKIDNSINTSTADSKYWIVSPDPTNIRHMHLGDMVISNLYIGEVEIKKVCLGEIIIYENKQVAADKDTLYNEFTGALFILKEDALSYDEEELALNINSDIINASYNEENLDIGGDK